MAGSDATDGGLASVKLLKHRATHFRLDWTPFALVYGIALGDAAKSALDGEREAATWIAAQVVAVAILHVLLALFCYWSVSVRATVRFVEVKDIHRATAVVAGMKGYTGKKALVPLTHRKLKKPLGEDHYEELGFEVAQQRYVYDYGTRSFQKLRYPVDESLKWYLGNEGLGSDAEVAAALANWGPNIFEVEIPPFSTLFKQQLLAPFFIFQVFCVSLWCMDDHWMYSVFTLCMLLFSESMVAGHRLTNLRHLRSLQSPKPLTQVYRSRKWEKIPGELLLPGDLISVGRPAPGHDELVIPADVVLLSGSCIVDESVLTGESTPQWKSALATALETPGQENRALSLKEDKAHVLFGGTKCLQHTSSRDTHIKFGPARLLVGMDVRLRSPDGGCLAVVIRTSFETAQGRLIGTILHSTEHVTANNWETGMFILFLLCFAVAASAYVLYHGLQDPTRSRFDLFLGCTMIITSVIPPELPMELSMAVNQSLIRLMRKKIFCTEPFRIPFAGKVDVCCFDKTGTLTDDSMILEGVVDANLDNSAGTVVSPKELPIEATRILVACHSLLVVDGELVGDPLEKAAFEAIGWTYCSDLAVHPKKTEELLILHRYPFSAQRKRMSTVVRCRSSNGRVLHVVLSKGAPEVMHQSFSNPPANYDRLYKSFAGQGGRILALGYRLLDDANPLDVSAMRGSDRDVAEAGMSFAGLTVFQCTLKPDSAPALLALKQSSHQLVMITGDAPLTACYAARHVHIITRPVLILQAVRGGAQEVDFCWVNPDETERIPFDPERAAILHLAEDWDLCITGEAFPLLELRRLTSFLLPLIQVFARVAPEHKEKVVETLRAEGRVVLMCGDGTNDVAGLKAAHVGVALLTGVLERFTCPYLVCSSQSGVQSQEASCQKSRAELRKSPTECAETKSQSEVVQQSEPTPATGASPRTAASSTNTAQRMIEEMERQGSPVNPRLRKIAELMDELNQDPGLLKPGDASMAAPFTAKQASAMPCTDLIMQGRSTLVSTVQMFKILGLMSLASAYALSVMHLQGVKSGDVQMTVTSILMVGMFLFLSNTQPLPTLSKTRPHPNIFCPYVFLSVLLQSSVHMSYLIYLYQCALELMPDPNPEDLTEAPEKSSFEPNLVNSVCFLVNFVIQIVTFAVNYSGSPFTTPLLQNKGLSWSLFLSAALVFFLALDIVPGLCTLLEMVPLPATLQLKILFLGGADFLLAFGIEALLRSTFPAPLPPEKGYLSHQPRMKKKQN